MASTTSKERWRSSLVADPGSGPPPRLSPGRSPWRVMADFDKDGEIARLPEATGQLGRLPRMAEAR